MTKKNWMLIATMLVLATVYVIWFTDWFKTKSIHISYTCRNTMRVMRHPDADNPTIPVMFSLGMPYRLTELKAYRLSDWATNHEALPVWHLTSVSNSLPVEHFAYGQNIRGMHPAVPGSQAEPLEPNETYHLIIESGRIKGEHDFITKPAS